MHVPLGDRQWSRSAPDGPRVGAGAARAMSRAHETVASTANNSESRSEMGVGRLRGPEIIR